MDDLNDLERRLVTALDRIGAGVAALAVREDPPEPGPDLPDPTLLMAQLEAEREVTAQLEERMRVLRERHEARVAELEARAAPADDGQPPREALQAELDDLRARRKADRAEVDAILAHLGRVVEEAGSDA
jgi:hypothetical protein